MSAVPLRRLALPLLALLALAYLAAMVVSGAQPVQRQLVKFEAKGVLQIEPEAVQKITLARGDQQSCWCAAATAGRWIPAARSRGLRRRTSIPRLRCCTVRHRSARSPRRTWSGVDTRPFGLEEPLVVAALSGPGGRVLTVRFGALNPEGFLQYVRIDGDPKVYLMSRFIGAEWTPAMEGREGAMQRAAGRTGG